MSISVDQNRARQIFQDAIAYVDFGADLPEEWVTRTVALGKSPSKTFIAMLGTALLSRATNPSIDPLVLKASAEPSAGMQSYSARAVATAVLAPMAVEHSIDIGTRGREPLNNQPFFRYDRVHHGMVVKGNARTYLAELIEALERVRELTGDELLPALAAFIAVRRSAVRKPVARIAIANTAWSLREFIKAVGTFVTSWPEDGKRGQALVAAALDLVFDRVVLGHVNDPSRHIPGDVFVFGQPEDSAQPIAVEVKQKVVLASDIKGWADALSRVGSRRGMYALLAPGQPDLDLQSLSRHILEERNVALVLFDSAETLLRQAMVWSKLDPSAFIGAFAMAMHQRLQEAGVTPETVEAWAQLFQDV